MTTQLVAKAVHLFIAQQIRQVNHVRRFFRLDGFEELVYQSFLDLIKEDGSKLTERPLQVRTTAPINGYKEFALNSEKSATWYRNHLQPGETLILIFNQRTSDAQSLKDIYRVTENLLATEGLDNLIETAFKDYQLTNVQIKDLHKFLRRLRQNLPHPQLRDLAAFLDALNTHLRQHPGTPIEDAIADSLPYLGLFRCRELNQVINTPKGDRLLKDVYQAANLRSQLLDDSDLKKWLSQLEKTEFDDERPYDGPSPEEKRERLRSFLSDQLADRDEWIPALNIDWSEVSAVLYKKARKTKSEKHQELARQVQDILKEQQIEEDELPLSIQDVIDDLTQGKNPAEEGHTEEIVEFIDEFGDGLPNQLKNQIRRLQGAKKYDGSDFIVGITDLAVQMIVPVQDDLKVLAELSVGFDRNQFTKVEARHAEALLAFRTMYGGIENLMPSVKWDLADLWKLVEENADRISYDEEEDGEREKVVKIPLSFDVRVTDEDDFIDSATLVWQYRSDSPTAVSLAQIQFEYSVLAEQNSNGPLFRSQQQPLRIPIFSTSPDAQDIGDLDLSQPIKSLGVWYQSAVNLRERLKEDLEPRAHPETWQVISDSLGILEKTYTEFIQTVAIKGLLEADCDELLTIYQSFLETATIYLQKGNEALQGFRLLTQAWMIGTKTFEDWAVMPLIHPIKLHWWHERTKQFNQFIVRLQNPNRESHVVDAKRFRQELVVTYSSANYPSLIALPDRSKVVHYFLPVQELDGYELYWRADKANLAYGLDPELVTEADSEQAAKVSARELTRVVQDYIETYPFVRDGLEIYIVQCRNSALPGLLVEQLYKISKKKNLRLNVIVHITPEQGGAPLYRRITAWLKTHEEFTTRPADDYFPPVSIKVLECSFDELVQQPEDTDLVLLPDVLAEKGQKLESILNLQNETSSINHLPIYRVQQTPFERDEYTRNIMLTPKPQSTLLQSFYNVQWAAAERKKFPEDNLAAFQIQVSLQDWEGELRSLHKKFNWVICYDTTVDRFLLENTLPEAVEVIRYSLGLGIKRRHNLTVSSTYRAQDVVIRRLTTNLEKLLPGTLNEYHEFRHKVASRLVNEAKQVSGDIVLRAAGPGAYLNELIGMVVAKHLTEKNYLEKHPGALIAWIYLDDFTHWFNHQKMPDLLFVAIPPEANGQLPLHIELIETKCVGSASFTREAVEAQQQIAQGINRLFQAWQPGNIHLDAPYWYYQLYQAVVGNLAVEQEQMRLWEVFRKRLPSGDFTLEMSGHSWVFCYDSSVDITGSSKDGQADITILDPQTVSHLYHHFGRAGLRKQLQNLVEQWQYEAPSDTWSPVYDLPLTAAVVTKTSDATEKDETDPESSKDTPALDSENIAESSSSTEVFQEDVDLLTPWLERKSRELTRTLRDYGIQIYPIEISSVDIGPSIVRFKVRLRPGETINRLQRIGTDLQRELAIETVPLIENVRGTRFVGIDLPHPSPSAVPLLPLLDQLPGAATNQLAFLVGKTADGQIVISDLATLPHLLVAGSTGSGKTVFLYSFIVSLLHQFGPDTLSLLLIDPKQTDFIFFEGLPHLISKQVIIEPEEAITWLQHLMDEELTNRTQQLRDARARDIHNYNARNPNSPMGFIVVVIDEYADLVQVLVKKEREEFERQLVRLAQRARNVGIHLVIATQRPSADIVTPRLKTNLPARIGFRLPSHHDSVTILDQAGAENLLGKGDMLFKSDQVVRLQAPYISTDDLISLLKSMLK